MSRLYKWLTILAVVMMAFANFVVSTTPVFACSCIAPPPPQEARDQSAAVFAGTVKNINVPEGEIISSADPVGITFDVSDVWKGEVSETQIITTPRDSASCGYAFEMGMDYLVYAYEGEDGLQTHLCSRTTLLTADVEDLNALGDSTRPEAGRADSSTTSNLLPTALLAGLAGLAVLALVAVVVIVNRRNTAATAQ